MPDDLHHLPRPPPSPETSTAKVAAIKAPRRTPMHEALRWDGVGRGTGARGGCEALAEGRCASASCPPSSRSARLGSINKVSYKPAMRFSKPNAWTSLIICTASLTTDDDFFVASVIADAPPSPRFFILSISPTDNMGTAASKHRPNFQEDDSDKPRPKPNAPTVWMNPQIGRAS